MYPNSRANIYIQAIMNRVWDSSFLNISMKQIMKQGNKNTKFIIFLIQQICVNSYCIQENVLQISGDINMNQAGFSLK